MTASSQLTPPQSRRQIAIVCDTVPYPTRSGDNQRIAELISVLRENGWHVHLVLCGLLERRLKKMCRSHVDALHVSIGAGLRTGVRKGVDRAGRGVGVGGELRRRR